MDNGFYCYLLVVLFTLALISFYLYLNWRIHINLNSKFKFDKMNRLILIFFFTLSVKAQINDKVEHELNKILQVKNSKDIRHSSNLFILQKEYGKKSLVYLAKFFDIPTITKVYSDCHKRFLTKGEVAIIIADQIERMPYFELTGIQNCTLTYCDDNSNLIEYYFDYLKSYNEFQLKYYQHIKSSR